ncbi:MULTISPECIES: hypothetical protein [unclassified Pseudonocardia]|uniref:hypothetical protein n=1 Tax=unclassified Pseudonocardia TaxID=2619320 RepID=UPI00095D8921|nr:MULTISPECIES: hypothetical protein [unclassified Pseudonocardia]MBN9098835.1 hypothetical protein [Pseudonocardia sp.]OJY40949.1 MAG: hypothetical protein BGP03_25395 [Pseudonocardia sp. 73-21]
MPIRTTRGRAAAYRSIWQWPLRSPARLVITVVGVVAVAVLAGAGAAAVGGGSNNGGLLASPGPTTVAVAPPSASDPSFPSGTSTTPFPTALPPVPALTPTTLPLAEAPAAALQVAGRWAAAWVRPPAGTTQQQWLQGLSATTTAEYLGILNTVDPSNIPATRVTGAPTALRVSPRSVQVEVPTDTVKLLVTVVISDAGDWRVSDSDRA